MGRGRGKSNAGVHISKPEPPAFLQRLREEIVANEDADRRERSEKKRKERPPRSEDLEDDPTVVKVNDDDLTEEEYKRMKLELETQYKLDDSKTNKKLPKEDLDVDALIEIRQRDNRSKDNPQMSLSDVSASSTTKLSTSHSSKTNRKTLSYGSSDDDDDDE